MTEQESSFVSHIPCDSCGSSDGNALYTDGHTYCHVCSTHVRGDGSVPTTSPRKKRMADLITGEYRDLIKRKLHETTARKFGYQIGEYNGKPVQIAPYFDSTGSMVAQKIRFPNKDFMVLGDLKEAQLFGANLWSSGKKIVITEGEIDAMSVSQIQGNKWPVVSVPTGSKGAKKALSKQLEYLNGFEEIILMFDMDEPGREASAECAELFSPGKCKIASLPLKDANECLVAGKDQEVIQAIWNAKSFRPDGLVSVADLLPELDKDIEQGLPWWSETLTKLTYGRRWGDIYAFGAGTGIGKTDFLTQQVVYDIQVLKYPVGMIFLEQKPLETAIRTAGKNCGKRLHVPDGSWTKEERKAEVQKLDEMITFYDSFGQTDWDVIANKIRFMAVSEGKRIFYLDHLTAMADTKDEKGSLEQIMKEMAGLAMELQIIIHFVSHLSTPEGKSHEEGGKVSSKHFKGSRAIQFWSYFMFGLERDTQAEDPAARSITTFRVVKDRFTGQATGETFFLGYDKETGRLYETTKPESTSGFKDETTSEF